MRSMLMSWYNSRKALKRIMKCEMYRLTTSIGMPVAIAVIVYSLLQPMWQYIRLGPNVEFLGSVLEVMELCVSQGAVRTAKYVAYAGVYALTFCQDIESQYVRLMILRSGKKTYIAAKLIVVTIGSFIATFLALALLFMVLNFRGFPLVNYKPERLAELYISGADLIRSGHIWRQCAIVWFSYAISATTWAMSAMAVSAYIQNRFVILFSPIVIYYLVDFVYYNVLGINELYNSIYVSLDYLGCAVTPFAQPHQAIYYLMLLHGPLILLSIAAFAIGAYRRLRDV